MKKSKILLFFSFLILIACLFAISAVADEPAATEIVGHNLALTDDSVEIIYIVDETIPEGAESGVLLWLESQAEYVYGFETYKITESYGTIENPLTERVCQKYAFADLSPEMMTVNLYAVSYVKEGENITYSVLNKYSILQYGFNKKDSETLVLDKTVTLGDLVTSILEYGAAKQKELGYNLDRLANDTYYQVTVVGGALPDGTAKGRVASSRMIQFSEWSYGEQHPARNAATIAAKTNAFSFNSNFIGCKL